MNSKRKEVYWSVDSSPAASLGSLTNDIGNIRPQAHPTAQIKKKTSRRSTLKTLCPEDKHKVRLLIEDLAKTGAEKDAIEQLLKKERHEFDEKLSQLQLEQQSLVEERTRLERSLQDSELKLRAIRSQNDELVKVNIPAFNSAPVGSHFQWSHDYSAPPTTVVNLDHNLNYLLQSTNSNTQPLEHCSSSTSTSSLVSSLHTANITPSQQPPTVVSQPHPPVHVEPRPSPVCSSSDAGTQTMMVAHTAVQTVDQYNVIPVVCSQQSVGSSEFNDKMEQMMATALLNARDTVNTIEALSQSLLMKTTVSREPSFITAPQLTSTQHVANNQEVTNSKDVTNTPGMTTIQELTNSHTLQECTSNQMDIRTCVPPSGHTPKSHANYMITPAELNYTLYDTSRHHEDTSLYLNRDDELQLEDLAETLNSTPALPMGFYQMSKVTAGSNWRKNSNIAMATQPVGEHHSDNDVINDLFFLQ